MKQSLELVNEDLNVMNEKRQKLSYMDAYRDELDAKRKLTIRINELQENMQFLEFEIKNIEESISKLSQEKKDIDFTTLQAIYEEAKSYVPDIQRSFEDMVAFHNSMIQNRIDFIRSQLVTKQELLEQYSQQLNGILTEKEKVTIEALDEGLLDELNMLNKQIEDLSLKKGEIQQSINLLEEQEQARSKFSKELVKIEEQMKSDGVEEKIKKFNQVFSGYCDKLYGEKYLLAYNEKWKEEGKFPVSIAALGDFEAGYKTRADASTRMSADQIADVALSLEYVKQYGASHKELNYKQVYLLEQCVVWQRLSVHLGWKCDNVRASYDEIPKATQDEVFKGAKAFVKENKGRYDCGGYIYSGKGQELGQFWAKLAVGNATLKKASDNSSITDGNGIYSIAGATYGVYADKDCKNQIATLTTDESGNTETVEVRAGTLYVKELSAPAGYKVDKNVYSLKLEAGKTATLNVSDTPKATDTLIELLKSTWKHRSTMHRATLP